MSRKSTKKPVTISSSYESYCRERKASRSQIDRSSLLQKTSDSDLQEDQPLLEIQSRDDDDSDAKHINRRRGRTPDTVPMAASWSVSSKSIIDSWYEPSSSVSATETRKTIQSYASCKGAFSPLYEVTSTHMNVFEQNGLPIPKAGQTPRFGGLSYKQPNDSTEADKADDDITASINNTHCEEFLEVSSREVRDKLHQLQSTSLRVLGPITPASTAGDQQQKRFARSTVLSSASLSSKHDFDSYGQRQEKSQRFAKSTVLSSEAIESTHTFDSYRYRQQQQKSQRFAKSTALSSPAIKSTHTFDSYGQQQQRSQRFAKSAINSTRTFDSYVRGEWRLEPSPPTLEGSLSLESITQVQESGEADPPVRSRSTMADRMFSAQKAIPRLSFQDEDHESHNHGEASHKPVHPNLSACDRHAAESKDMGCETPDRVDSSPLSADPSIVDVTLYSDHDFSASGLPFHLQKDPRTDSGQLSEGTREALATPNLHDDTQPVIETSKTWASEKRGEPQDDTILIDVTSLSHNKSGEDLQAHETMLRQSLGNANPAHNLQQLHSPNLQQQLMATYAPSAEQIYQSMMEQSLKRARGLTPKSSRAITISMDSDKLKPVVMLSRQFVNSQYSHQKKGITLATSPKRSTTDKAVHLDSLTRKESLMGSSIGGGGTTMYHGDEKRSSIRHEERGTRDENISTLVEHRVGSNIGGEMIGDSNSGTDENTLSIQQRHDKEGRSRDEIVSPRFGSSLLEELEREIRRVDDFKSVEDFCAPGCDMRHPLRVDSSDLDIPDLNDICLGTAGSDFDCGDINDDELRAVMQITKNGDNASIIFPSCSCESMPESYSDDGLSHEMSMLSQLQEELESSMKYASFVDHTKVSVTSPVVYMSSKDSSMADLRGVSESSSEHDKSPRNRRSSLPFTRRVQFRDEVQEMLFVHEIEDFGDRENEGKKTFWEGFFSAFDNLIDDMSLVCTGGRKKKHPERMEV